MSESARSRKSRDAGASRGSQHVADPAAAPLPLAAPAWAAGPAAMPFGLGGIQRKVVIGQANDVYECEAESVASRVQGGQRIAPNAISPIGSLPTPGISQRAGRDPAKKDEKQQVPLQKSGAPDPRKKEDKPQASMQKAAVPEQKKKDEKPQAHVQKASAPEQTKKKNDKPAAPLPVAQKAAASEPKKDEKKKEPAARVQKAENKKEEPIDKKLEQTPIQKAGAPKNEEKEKPKASAVLKANVPKKNEKEKPKATAVQKAEKKKEEPKAKAVQKEEKKKEEPKAKAVPKAEKKEDPKSKAVQKAEQKKEDPRSKPVQKEEKKKEEPKAKAVQKEEKKREEPKTKAVQKADREKKKDDSTHTPPAQKAEKKKDEPQATPPIQKADASPAAAGEKKREKALGAVQKTPQDLEKKEETPGSLPVQTAAATVAHTAAPSMEQTASTAIGTKGAGEPLHAPIRTALESHMGIDLESVRVHQDESARRHAAALEARAFTHGNDIWLGPGESQSDVGLMAHEATHVVQQAGGVHRMLVQRTNGSGSGAGGGSGGGGAPATGGASDPEAPNIELPLPPLKSRHRTLYEGWASAGQLKRPKGYDRGKPDQRSVWMSGVTVSPAALEALHLTPNFPGQKGIKLPGNKKREGTYADFLEWSKVPDWDRRGQKRVFQVDHMIELQVAAQGAAGPANTVENLELYDRSANTSAGSTLKNNIRRRVGEHLRHAGRRHTPDDVAQFLREHDVNFDRVGAGAAGGVSEGDSAYWTRTEIQEGVPLRGAEPGPNPGEAGGPESFALLSPGGGIVLHQYDHARDATTITPNSPVEQRPVAGLKIMQVGLNPNYHQTPADGAIGSITAEWDLPEKIVPQGQPSGLQLFKSSAGQYSGYIGPLPPITSDLQGMSEIRFDEVRFRSGALYAVGRLTPSIPLLRGSVIEVRLIGRDIEFAFVYNAGAINLPVPGLTIDNASLGVFFGTRGLGVEGGLDVSVRGLGSGSLEARLDSNANFSAQGIFNFDSQLFDEATISIWYRNGQFGGSGNLAISGPNKVRGIRRAAIHAEYDAGRFHATGTVQPAIPGIREAGLEIAYSESDGLSIGGNLQLADNVPGISSGSVEVLVVKRDGRWMVAAHGTAVPRVPGVSTTLTIDYNDGAFDISGTAAYERGMLRGTLTLGATNRPIGPDGRPAGAPAEASDRLTAYGSGSATIRIAPWLQATAGIRLLPNGEVEIMGEIGLPSTLDIFPEKRLDKNIFTIGIDIPIVGVAVAGQRIGIFATIAGGLDLTAGIGPGQLQDVHLRVTYNPSHEDQTHVEGGAKLHIPAHAGLRLFVRGALGVGIPIVSAQAGIEIGGQLGLEGAVDASVNVDWMPSRGLQIDAAGEIYVQPKFTFDITGFVLVEADLLLTTIELYSKRWQLAAMEYGSDLRFGVKFPIRYREGQPFDISLSDVEFEVPNVDAGSVLRGLISRIA